MHETGVIIHFKPILRESDLEKFLEDFPATAMHPRTNDDSLSRTYFLKTRDGEENRALAELKKSYGSIIETLRVYQPRAA